MGLFGKLFGSDKATEKLVDNISTGIDKIWYTAEEKAEDKAQARREGQAVFMEWLKSTSGSRLARRWLALIVTVPWSMAHFASMVFNAVAPFITTTEKVFQEVNGELKEVTILASDKWSNAADSLSANATENNALVGVVLLFYFGGPAAVDTAKGLVEKWAGKQ